MHFVLLRRKNIIQKTSLKSKGGQSKNRLPRLIGIIFILVM